MRLQPKGINMKQLRLAALLSAVVALSGCSTMFNSGSQTIQAVASNGKDIKVNITTPAGTYTSKLPATIVAEPSTFKGVSIMVQDDCYDPTQLNVNTSIAPSYWANIFNAGYGFLIDPFTGAMWKYNNMVSVPVNEKREKPASCKS
jgi:hypothetical protein